MERKYILNSLPVNIDKFEKIEIEEGFISFKPEILIKRENNKYFFIKKINDIVEKKEINKNCYNLLLPCIQDDLIVKTRYIIPISARLNANVDLYHNNLEGLHFLEIYFETEEEKEQFVAPKWFGTEINKNETPKIKVK